MSRVYISSEDESEMGSEADEELPAAARRRRIIGSAFMVAGIACIVFGIAWIFHHQREPVQEVCAKRFHMSQLEEKPSTPTLITPANRGRCYPLAKQEPGVSSYTWWIGDEQRCTSVYIPPDAPKPMPVTLRMNCYDKDEHAAEPFGRFPVAAFALSTDYTYYNKKKKGYKGAWRLGNNGIVNDANPQPCSTADSPDIAYLMAVFKFIEDDPATFDSTKIYTVGFSQNGAFSAYAGFCFSNKIAGIVQSGSGLMVKSENIKPSPALGGVCARSDFDKLGKSCAEKAPCAECEYWPIYPCYNPNPVVYCSFGYKEDTVTFELQEPMYVRTIAEGYDSRRVVFNAGTHQEPKNLFEWYAGCLGLTETCSPACAADFATCVQKSRKQDDLAYNWCATERLPASCSPGCSPTTDMLSLSEQPASVRLSKDTWGATESFSKERPDASKCQYEASETGE